MTSSGLALIAVLAVPLARSVSCSVQIIGTLPLC
jgi:hypothetical protein